MRWGDAAVHLIRCHGWSSSQQGRELKQCRSALSLQRRDAGPDLRDESLGAHNVELRVRAGFIAVDSDFSLATYDIERMSCHLQFFADGADLRVRARRLRCNRYLHTVVRRGNSIRVRACCLDGPANAAQIVELIANAQHSVIDPDVPWCMAGDRQDFVRTRIPSIGDPDSGIGLREEGVACSIQHRAGCEQIGLGRLQVCVGLESLLQQMIQSWVMIQTPPIVGGSAGVSAAADTDTNGACDPGAGGAGR